MAGGQLTIQGVNIPLTNGAGTEQVGPLTITIPTPIVQQNSLTFSSGTFISTAGPVGSTLCFIIPPTANLVQLTLKGITGDTGIPISANLPFYVPFFNPAVSNSIGLTSAAAITGVVVLLWI